MEDLELASEKTGEVLKQVSILMRRRIGKMENLDGEDPNQRCKKLQMLQIYLCYFFSAGANLWASLSHFWAISAILGHFWANLVILGHFWAILGHFRSFLGYFG